MLECLLTGLLWTVKQADCLLETQAHVLEKFVTGMMAKKAKNPKASDANEEAQENPDEEQIEGEYCCQMN
jgi:hypothetical protein